MFTDFPCAKINLGLNIVNRRADGYHDLETVFYPVGICDEIRMEACSDKWRSMPFCGGRIGYRR